MAEAKPPRPRNVLLAEFPGLSKDDASQALRDTGGDLDRARKLIKNAKPHAQEQPPMSVSSSLLLALPDDVLRRVIVGVLRDDHHVVASVCKVLLCFANDMASQSAALLPSIAEASCK